MSRIKFKGEPVNTSGELPKEGEQAPDFLLTGEDLSDYSLNDFNGIKLVLNIFPSIDTGVCAASVRRFNKEADNLSNIKILGISRDLPFAQARFCGAEGIENVITLSEMRQDNFGEEYGVKIIDGPLAGLFSRAVIVLDANHTVLYNQQVPDIASEPDYDDVLKNL